MPVIKNKILPFGKKFFAINLFGLIFAKGECSVTTLNHEKIHTRQMIDLLVFPFYLFYLIEWVIRLIQYRDFMQAYRNISFEREAYSNQNDLKYLKRRKWGAFASYLGK